MDEPSIQEEGSDNQKKTISLLNMKPKPGSIYWLLDSLKKEMDIDRRLMKSREYANRRRW